MKKYVWIAIVLVAVLSVLALRGWDKDPAGKNEDTTVADAATDTTGAAPDTTKAPDTTVAPDTTKAPETTIAPDSTDADTTKAEETTTEAATEEDTTASPETTKEEETTKAPQITEPEETTAAILEINESTAVLIAKDFLGEKDPDTGYTYSYQYVETTAEGNYKIRVSWYLEEDDRYSTCGYLIVTPKGEVSKFDW